MMSKYYILLIIVRKNDVNKKSKVTPVYLF